MFQCDSDGNNDNDGDGKGDNDNDVDRVLVRVMTEAKCLEAVVQQMLSGLKVGQNAAVGWILGFQTRNVVLLQLVPEQHTTPGFTMAEKKKQARV
jgi:hypothetical protein